MVKKYSELYREARKALLPIDGPHQAGTTARELLQDTDCVMDISSSSLAKTCKSIGFCLR